MVLSLVIFKDIVPLRHRPKWYGFVLGAWALGNCLGPVLGGVLAEKATWRWIFYIMFPFCALGLLLVITVLTLSPPRATLQQKLGSIDWIGTCLFIPSGTLFLIAISWGGIQFTWSRPGTLIPLSLGTLGFLTALLYELRYATSPFLERLALLPVLVTLVPSSIIAGWVVTRTSNYRWLIWIGWALATAGSGLTLLFTTDTPIAVWVVVLIILGLGHGAILNAQNFAAQAMSREGEQGTAAAMYAFARQFGMALGVGIGGCVFQNVMSSRLRQAGLDIGIASVSEAFVAELHQMRPDSPLRSQILDAYCFGLRGIYLVFTSISGVALFLSMLMKHFDMAEEVISEHELQQVFKIGH
ncbi:major facilitator superfamily domain-containing protein [Diaporthe sp. PMI_573]|nr:major facilitator superfamily domain-containing protein [Diaporthaceae sp. PMI_573]